MQVANPKAVKEVEIDGAKFRIGMIPFGRRVEIEAMADLKMKVEAPEQIKARFLQNYAYVKASVKGHSGLTYEGGEEVPFSLGEDKEASEETMAAYSVNPVVLVKIASAVMEFNYLKGEVAKN